MIDRFHLGVCYYPEHWSASRHADDFRRMRDAGFDVVRMGESAWGYFEPQEGKFRFDLFDRAIDLCRRFGIKVIMGTPTYAGPAWIANQYPEVLRWNFQRIPMKHGSRRNFNYTSPKYLELSDRICTALAEHYADEKQIVGWQLDNEFNCHIDVSYAPSDTFAFRRWLREKYKTLANLNQAWGTAFWSQQYTDWDQLDLPHPTSAPPNPTQILDESRFISETVVAFARRQAAILRKFNKKWFITHNGLFGNIDGPALAETLDFFSHDQYPLFSDTWPARAGGLVLARSLSFPFAIMEQQSGPGGQMTYLQPSPRPGELRLWAWQSIAHGAKLLSFFRWRTCPYGAEQHWHGLLDQDNKDNRRLAEAKELGKELRKLPADFFDAAPSKVAAIFRDFDNEINERRINTYTKTGEGEFAAWLRGLTSRHIPADYVWPGSRFGSYRILILPHVKIVSPELAERLRKYVSAGGTLVLGAQAGLKNVDLHIVERIPPGLLAKLAGIEIEDWTSLGTREMRTARIADGRQIRMGTFVERIRPATAEVIGRWIAGDSLLGDAPAVTVNRFGKGQVYYIGGYCNDEAISSLIEYLSGREKISTVDAPAEVEIMLRSSGKTRYLVALNHSSNMQRISGIAGRELLTGRNIDRDLVLPSLGVAVVRLRGGIQPPPV
jgi:beta-galactosidase